VLLSAPDLAATWASRNSCEAMPDTMMLPNINTEDSSSVNLYTYNNCEMDAEVRLYEIIGGGHTWSDGPPAPPGFEILGNVNRDVSSSEEMWQFFQRFSHPAPREGTIIEESDVGLLSRSLMVEGTERTYKVYVPLGFEEKEDWAVVFNLHGFAGSGTDQLIVSDMNAVADTAGFLVVYPQGLDRESLGDTGPGWNGGRHPELVDDVAFFDALIDELYGAFDIDLSRVYATGLSQGGGMTYLLASDLGDRIAAIAPVAATMENTLEYTPTRPVPILQIHGTADGLVPYAGSDVLPLLSVDSSLQFWLNYNSCAEGQTLEELPDITDADNSTVTRITYTGCPEDAEVVHYRVNGGGHTWPGGPGSPVFFGPTNQDFHASSTIWNFFARHVHPDPVGVPRLLEKTVTVDGAEREYLLYVPADYDGSEEWPLVLNFHGFLSNPFEQIFVSQMNLVADTADFLVAYPVGLPIDASDIEGEINPILPSAGPGWNVYGFLAEHDDLEFTKQIIQQTDSEFTLDNNRVYAAGMSFGGIMTYYLACELNDQIAAFASVTGDMPKDQRFDCAPDKSVPILHIHGTEDPIAPYDGSLIGIGPEATVQFWRDNNQCMTEPVETPFEDIDTTDNSTVTLFEYDCADDSEVLFYRIDGGGHTWPNGLPAPPGFEFLGTVNQDFFASTEIWNFFNRHVLTPDTTTSTSERLAAEEISLQVFPNPFSDQLNFTFEIPQTQRVQLNIFNALGQPIKTLIDQRLPAGPHRIEWKNQAQLLPAGVYYYRLQLGARSISRPVIIK
jgi:polyhydroxybutyrate depolymerase